MYYVCSYHVDIFQKNDFFKTNLLCFIHQINCKSLENIWQKFEESVWSRKA